MSQNPNSMKLGVFSISLNVKDLEVSREFYEKLGFSVFAGSKEYNYFIMKNGPTLIGLFQGMFPKNILTFNPGWDDEAKTLDNFEDVRTLQKRLKESGIKFETEADETVSGPGNFTILDPDGNPILVDQHI